MLLPGFAGRPRQRGGAIDKLSILVTIVFSWIVLKEKLTPKAAVGLVLILAGTGAMLL